MPDHSNIFTTKINKLKKQLKTSLNNNSFPAKGKNILMFS